LHYYKTAQVFGENIAMIYHSQEETCVYHMLQICLCDSSSGFYCEMPSVLCSKSMAK